MNVFLWKVELASEIKSKHIIYNKSSMQQRETLKEQSKQNNMFVQVPNLTEILNNFMVEVNKRLSKIQENINNKFSKFQEKINGLEEEIKNLKNQRNQQNKFTKLSTKESENSLKDAIQEEEHQEEQESISNNSQNDVSNSCSVVSQYVNDHSPNSSQTFSIQSLILDINTNSFSSNEIYSDILELSDKLNFSLENMDHPIYIKFGTEKNPKFQSLFLNKKKLLLVIVLMNKNNIVCYNKEIFGSEHDYSQAWICNLSNKLVIKIKPLYTATKVKQNRYIFGNQQLVITEGSTFISSKFGLPQHQSYFQRQSIKMNFSKIEQKLSKKWLLGQQQVNGDKIEVQMEQMWVYHLKQQADIEKNQN